MLARCRVHEVSQEWGCEWGSSYMNESIHSVSSHDCRFLRSRMRGSSLFITRRGRVAFGAAGVALWGRNFKVGLDRGSGARCFFSTSSRVVKSRGL